MAKKSRKMTSRAATKKRSSPAKRMKVARQTTRFGKKKKTKSARKAARKTIRRASPAKPRGAIGTIEGLVDAAQEASEMRDRMTPRGPLGEG